MGTPFSFEAIQNSICGKRRSYWLITNAVICNCHLPSQCTYYWAQLDRRRAEEKLADQPEGTFLLRDSSDECHFFALSFRIPNQTLHVLMSYNQGES